MINQQRTIKQIKNLFSIATFCIGVGGITGCYNQNSPSTPVGAVSEDLKNSEFSVQPYKVGQTTFHHATVAICKGLMINCPLARVSLSEKAEYVAVSGTPQKIVAEHARLTEAMRGTEGISFEGRIWRGIPETVEVDGQVIRNTEADIFEFHKGTQSADHRLTLGGPEGQSGIYSSVGPEPVAWPTAAAELGEKADQPFVFGHKDVQLSKVLDLTDSQVLERLGLQSDNLTIIREGNTEAYLGTHIIGDVAEKAGFDGILFKSSKGPGNNLVIFRGGMK